MPGPSAHILRPIRIPLLILIVCVLALATALAAQYWGGLRPCELCLRQRYAYVAAGAAGLAGIGCAALGWRRATAAMVALAGLAFATGAGIAIFHVGVEQHWWQGSSACDSSLFKAGASIGDITKAIENAPMVRCDQIAWSLAGISMAGYNAILSVGLALAAFLAAHRLWRTS